MKISIIVAADKNGCIGKDGSLPWSFKEDMQWFKQTTMGHAVIFGRKTIESLPKKLDGRFVCRISSSRIAPDNNILFDYSCPNLDTAIAVCRHRGYNRCFIGGGAAIYQLGLKLADDILLTEIPGEYTGDTKFPVWPLEQHGWIRSEEIPVENSVGLKFYTFLKNPG